MYLGLTGNIASGKSTAAQFFKELGAYVLDADDISRIVMQPGQEAYNGVVKLFGEKVLNADRTLDRAAIRKIVFDEPETRKKLEQIVQPAILEYERKEVGRIKGQDDKAVIITQAAVTVESGTYKRFDGLIVVYTEPEIQLKRVMARDNISEAQALKIIGAQMPIEEKLKFANYIVNNSGSLNDLRRETARVFELIKLTKYGMKNA